MKQEQLKKGVDIISLGSAIRTSPRPRISSRPCAADRGGPQESPVSLVRGDARLRKAAADWYRSASARPLTRQRGPRADRLQGRDRSSPVGVREPRRRRPGPRPGLPGVPGRDPLRGGESYFMPADPERNFCRTSAPFRRGAECAPRSFWLNYPNNPTGAVAPREFPGGSGRLCPATPADPGPDAPYSEIASYGYRPESILSIDGPRTSRSSSTRSPRPTHDGVGAWVRVGNAQILGRSRPRQTERGLRGLPGGPVRRASPRSPAPSSAWPTTAGIWQERGTSSSARSATWGSPWRRPGATF